MRTAGILPTLDGEQVADGTLEWTSTQYDRVTRSEEVLMGGKLRARLILSLVFVLLAGWPAVEAGNISLTPPAPPPAAGTTVVLSTASVQVVSPARVRVDAQLMKEGAPVTLPATVHFSVVEGEATIDRAMQVRRSTDSGVAYTTVDIGKAGQVVVRATCEVAGCTADLTLQATAP